MMQGKEMWARAWGEAKRIFQSQTILGERTPGMMEWEAKSSPQKATITLANPRQPCPEIDLGPGRRAVPQVLSFPLPQVFQQLVWLETGGQATKPCCCQRDSHDSERCQLHVASSVANGQGEPVVPFTSANHQAVNWPEIQYGGEELRQPQGAWYTLHIAVLALKLSTCPAETLWHWLKASSEGQWSTLTPVTKPYTYGQLIFTKKAKTIQWGNDNLISKWCQDNWIST